MKQSDDGGDGLPAAQPLPNYGRGGLYGLVGTVIGVVVWAAYMIFADSYSILLPVGAGWFASTCVKRGMITVDRTGIALSIYFTVLIIFLGEYLYYICLSFSATDQLLLGNSFGNLVGYFWASPKDFFFLLLFTGLGFVVAVINCREGRKKEG